MKSALFFIAAFAAFASVSAHANETATSIEPVYTTTTRTECQQASAGAPNWLGTSLGAIVGASGGSAIGKGKGNNIATASGAVLGSQVGAALAGNGSGQPAQQCHQVVDRQHNGYLIRTDRGNTVFVPTYLMQAR